MGQAWSCEHLERRIERYYRLAAATKLPEIRQFYIDRARHYRKLLISALAIKPLEPRLLAAV
ncbi:hypothetical protein LWE61_05325 [Sphingobium sufflavum]|uniref:hypothetical protein n=1 Tax=Sphingobium sufflavum TaxID=1129547 RepID=UPI001F285850|nr:hypothetical protein [Sphingobium sufflavum]MCE7795981.1 hypothetical protein [Sphingobium sufflavum]